MCTRELLTESMRKYYLVNEKKVWCSVLLNISILCLCLRAKLEPNRYKTDMAQSENEI